MQSIRNTCRRLRPKRRVYNRGRKTIWFLWRLEAHGQELIGVYRSRTLRPTKGWTSFSRERIMYRFPRQIRLAAIPSTMADDEIRRLTYRSQNAFSFGSLLGRLAVNQI